RMWRCVLPIGAFSNRQLGFGLASTVAVNSFAAFKALSEEALQYSGTPALQYSSTPVLQYSSTPALQYSSTPILQYSSTPVLQYSSTPVLQYSSTPLPLVLASCPLRPLPEHSRTPRRRVRIAAQNHGRMTCAVICLGFTAIDPGQTQSSYPSDK